jgi:superfamily II RNA helicase
LLEGDIIRLFRRIIDMLRQILKATRNNELKNKVSNCLRKLDRDIVRADF